MILHALRYELIALTRNKRRIVFTLAFPLVLLVALSATAGDATVVVDGAKLPLQRFYLPGILAMSVISGCFAALVQVVVGRRESGITRRQELTPATRGTLAGALVLSAVLLALGASAVLLIVARVAFGVGVSAPALGVMAITVTLGALAVAMAAFLVAGRIHSADGAQPVVQLVMFPVLFLSGIWFPADGLPRVLQDITDALPAKPLADALRQATQADTFSAAFDARHLTVLLAWAVGAALLVSRSQRGRPQGPLATRRVSAAMSRKTWGWRREVSEKETVPASASTL